jgi:2-(3-amino-3-carboxypropyl)histidine synthase
LGRQGNIGILDRLIKKVEGVFEYMVLIASEVNVELLTSVEVDFFVQIACPRLSIDWSYGTPKPLLTPFELYALIDKYDLKESYSMDYYSYNGGPWSNFYGKNLPKKAKGVKNEPKIKLEMEKCCKVEGPACR